MGVSEGLLGLRGGLGGFGFSFIVSCVSGRVVGRVGGTRCFRVWERAERKVRGEGQIRNFVLYVWARGFRGRKD